VNNSFKELNQIEKNIILFQQSEQYYKHMSEAQNIIEQLSKNPDDFLKDKSYEEILQIFKSLNPYGQIINPKATDFTCLSYLPMRDEHIHKISTTAIIGYVYRALEEYEDLLNISDKVKIDTKYSKIIEANKRVVQNFLDHIFEYNPERDVMSAYDKPGEKCVRNNVSLDEKNHPYPILTDGIGMPGCNCQQPVDRTELLVELEDIYSELCNVNNVSLSNNDSMLSDEFRNEELKTNNVNNNPHYLSSKKKLNSLIDKVKCMNNRVNSNNAKLSLNKTNYSYTTLNGICDDVKCKCRKLSTFPVPSRDLFRRLSRYTDGNWEKIVKVASDMYYDKIDIETAIQVHKHFKNLENAKQYELDNGIKVPYPITTVKDGPWTLLTPCADNKQNVNYNTTSELKEMLDRGNKEKSLVKEMTSKRIQRKIKRSIIENNGDYDREGIEKYAKTSGMGGGKTLLDKSEKEEIDKFVQDYKTGKIDPRLLYENVDEDGIPLDAVQIDVVETDGKNLKKYPMYTQADWIHSEENTERKLEEQNETQLNKKNKDSKYEDIVVEE